MRRAVTVALVVGGLLVTTGCESETPVPQAVSATPSTSAASKTATPTATPSSEVRTVTERQRIPYRTRKVSDAGLAKGTTKVRRQGRAGIKTLTYRVTLTGGVQTGKELIRQAVARRPVDRIIAVGTKAARRCDPNYSGCVPIADDVDCAGGSGNGPAYVTGPVRVIGSDVYDLDRDGDGVACDT
ncbi:G5 domain-containing protein [Spirillospora albida]|uniref:G5 domain-containing protein n=1 Tax=Spirillospora albida TaxID=58123 RepID=UPI000A008365|nr:G5 domain-containing protein [Spirillospora albida]